MKTYIRQLFTGPNTCSEFGSKIMARSWLSAQNKAQKASKGYFYPVVIKGEDGRWVKFEKGQKVEWSINA